MAIPFQVLILGSGSAIPGKDRNHSAQLLTYRNSHILLDCGEGTQNRMRQCGASIQKISHIFISHLHGDHYLGLAGLISSMNLLGRVRKLHIYGPPGLKSVIDLHFRISSGHCSFPLIFAETQAKSAQVLLEEGNITVTSFPLRHKIPTTGFLIRAGSRKRRLIREMIEKYKVPKQLRAGIADGKDFLSEDGKKVKNEELTMPAVAHRTYAYCTDTSFLPSIAEQVSGVDLLYHESSFLKRDGKKAKAVFHSTAEEAAEIARRVDAGKLLIGHFSAKYDDKREFLEEARSVFQETYIAEEGKTYEI